jgi:thioredoxin reductase (NADPH)
VTTDGSPVQYDVAVVGAGPAGVSAAINVRNRGRSVLVLGGQAPFGRVKGPHEVGNYAGFPAAKGDDLVAAFRRHLEVFDIAVTSDRVTKVVPDGDGSGEDGYVLFGGGDYYCAKTVVLATGVVLDATIEGEDDLVGQGVSYCVTCDGRLFAGRSVAFISYGTPGEDEAAELADAFGVDVTYLPQYEAQGGYRLPAGVHVRAGETPERLARAEDGVHVAIKGAPDGSGARDAQAPAGGELVADAVFLYREAVAPRTLLDGLDADGPHLVVDLHMRTSLPGVFAAGDCAGGPYQVAKAVGQGQVAALSAVRLLRERAEAAAPPAEPPK